MKLSLQVADGQSSPSAGEPRASEDLTCDQAAPRETKLREPEDRPEDRAASPHMNVIVKEEEEEEPLCGT